MSIVFVQAPTGSTNQANTNGAASLTCTYNTAPTAGNLLVAGVDFDSTFAIGTITSVTTTGGSGSDTLALVNNFAGSSGFGSVAVFTGVCGSGRTGVIVTYSNGSFMEITLWEVSGLTSPVADVIFTSSKVSSQSVSGTTGSLAVAAEAAICLGQASDTYDGGATNPFTAGTWTWDFTSDTFSGNAYGHQVTSSTSGLATTLHGPRTMNCQFGVVTFKSGSSSLVTGWQNESADVYQGAPQKLSAAPAFVSTFKTAPIAGMGFHEPPDKIKLPPSVVFSEPPAFISTFKTAGISGSAWNAQRDHARLPPSVAFSDAPAYGHPAFATGISGIAWYEPPDRDVPARKINIEALPAAFVSTFKTAPISGMAWFIPPDSYGLVEKIIGGDGPSMGRAPTPSSFGWFVAVDVPGIERPQIQQYDPSDIQRPFGAAVGISGMAWYKQPDIPGIVEKVFDSGIAGPTNAITQIAFGWFMPPDRDRPAIKANVESSPAYVRPPKVFTPISGIGWFEPPDRDAPATKFKIEAPPSIALTPATLPVRISGMAWFAPRDRDWHSASVTFDHPPAFVRSPFTTITGTLAATEGYDIASFVISFSRWSLKNIQSETWANRTKQDETWIVRTIQPETWTPE